MNILCEKCAIPIASNESLIEDVKAGLCDECTKPLPEEIAFNFLSENGLIVDNQVNEENLGYAKEYLIVNKLVDESYDVENIRELINKLSE